MLMLLCIHLLARMLPHSGNAQIQFYHALAPDVDPNPLDTLSSPPPGELLTSSSSSARMRFSAFPSSTGMLSAARPSPISTAAFRRCRSALKWKRLG